MMHRIITTLTLIRNNSFLVFISLASIAILGMISIMLVGSRKEIEIPPILQIHADIPIFVGEQQKVLTQREITVKENVEFDTQQRLTVSSRAIPGQTNTVFISNGRITGVSHHVPTSKNLTIFEAESYFLTEESTEMRNSEHPFSQAVNIYPDQGVAVQFHPTTSTVQMIFQFVPNRQQDFLSQNNHLIPVEEIPEEVGEEENYSQFFATVEEATDETRRE